jgi:hypothetical protein
MHCWPEILFEAMTLVDQRQYVFAVKGTPAATYASWTPPRIHPPELSGPGCEEPAYTLLLTQL